MPASNTNARAWVAGGLRRQRHGRPVVLFAVLTLVLTGWSAAVAAASTRDDGPSEVRGTADPRELFRSGGGHGGSRIGRLAVQLVQGGTVRQVGLDYRFRTGDRFRFGVSSNQAGWLYVLHRSPAGEPQLLWPRLAEGSPGGHLDDNGMRVGQTSLIPPAPDVFLFTDDVGNEYFYVVIRPERRAPELSVLTLQDPAQGIQAPAPRPVVPARPDSSGIVTARVPAAGQQKIVQFSVRGMGKGQTPMRGVVLLPGGGNADPNAYFAPDPKDEGGSVVFEFRLRHGE